MEVLDFINPRIALPHPHRHHIAKTIARLIDDLADSGLHVRVQRKMVALGDIMAADPATRDKGLYPALSPLYRPDHADRFALVAFDADGRSVATSAAVRDRVPVHYQASWESMALLAEPQIRADWQARGLRFHATCSAPIALQIRGEVVGLYGVWTAERLRQKGISKKMVHLTYALSYAIWRLSWLVGLVWPDLHSAVIWRSYGFFRAEPCLTIDMPGCQAADMRLTANTLAELEDILGLPSAWERRGVLPAEGVL